MKSIVSKYYGLIPLLLLFAFYVFKAIDFPIHDFSNYYFGGTFLANDNFTKEIYFPYEFNKAIADLGYPNHFVNYAPNTPFLAVLFLPFSFFSIAIAKLVFNTISVGLILFSIYRLFSFYKINPKSALLITVLFFIPIKNNLLFGQVYFLLFFLLTEGWLAYEKKRYKTVAFFWSFAIMLKIFPLLLLVFLVFKKAWKATFYLMASCGILLGVTVFFTGFDLWLFYLKEVLPKASNGEIATSFVDNYQSVFMFLKRLFAYETVENPHPFFHSGSWFIALVFAFKIGILTIGYFFSKNVSNTIFVFSYWILAMILLSPYGSTYTFILLIFPFLALLKSDISNIKKAWCCIILFLISNLPISLFISNIFPFSYLRLFLLLAFFVVFVAFLFQKLVWKKAILYGGVVSALGVFLMQHPTQKGENFLAKGSPILIYDYQIKNNQLTYFYWNEKGENKVSIPFKSSSFNKLDIKGNQIVYKNRMLTTDNSHKYKPLLIDNKTVLYLSDYDRGIGFYTLRKIEIN